MLKSKQMQPICLGLLWSASASLIEFQASVLVTGPDRTLDGMSKTTSHTDIMEGYLAEDCSLVDGQDKKVCEYMLHEPMVLMTRIHRTIVRLCFASAPLRSLRFCSRCLMYKPIS